MSEQQQQTCDVCGEPWAVKFEWTYTSTERYCLGHILEPIDDQPGKMLLDYMPDCQRITHRITQSRLGDTLLAPHPVEVKYRSLAMLYPVLTGRLA